MSKITQGKGWFVLGLRPFSRLVYPMPEPNTSGLGVHATVDLQGVGLKHVLVFFVFWTLAGHLLAVPCFGAAFWALVGLLFEGTGCGRSSGGFLTQVGVMEAAGKIYISLKT